MIITEEKTYSMSLMLEEPGSTSALNKKSYEVEFTNRELIHAAFTCGMPIQRLTPAYRGKRQMEFLQKIILIERALEAEGDRLKKSHDLDYLDSSEKSMISYYLGMIFTKLISGKLFNMDYLTHVNLIPSRDGNGYIDLCQMRRSDLIGYQRSSGTYSVFGAIGRSENSPRALENGCILAQSIKNICDQVPQMAAVSMTYYENSYLTAYIKTLRSQGECELKFEPLDFYTSYYTPMMEFFGELSDHTVQTAGGGREVTVFLPHFDGNQAETTCRNITVGILDEVYGQLKEKVYSAILEAPAEQPLANALYIGKDHIYIR